MLMASSMGQQLLINSMLCRAIPTQGESRSGGGGGEASFWIVLQSKNSIKHLEYGI